MSDTQNFRVKNGLDVTGSSSFANSVTASGNVSITGNNSLVITSANNNVSANIAGKVSVGNTVTISNGGLSIVNSSSWGILVADGGMNVAAGAVRLTVNNDVVTIAGDLIVSGNTTITGTIDTETTSLLLNSGIDPGDTPFSNVTIGVDRGSQSNVFLLWDESTNTWKYTNDGTYYFPLRSYNHLVYGFNTNTDITVTPGIGKIKFNSDVYSLANTITTSIQELGTADISEFLKILDNSDSIPKAILTFRSAENPNKFVSFSLDNSIDIASNNLFYSFPVTHLVTSNTDFIANEIIFLEYSISGQKGQKGEKGDKGQKGERTSNATYTDANNTITFTNSDSSTYNVTGVKGDKGEKGQKGEIGEIANATYTDANNTITFTNQSGGTFDVNGVKGQKGSKGERVSSASYTDSNNTVTFTNSDTSTFDVTGVKGQKGDARGIFYYFDTTTTESAGAPAAASLLFNSTLPADVTSITLRSVDKESVNNQTYFEYFNAYGNSTNKGFITIRNVANTAQTVIYNIANVVSTAYSTQKRFNVNAVSTNYNSQFPSNANLAIEISGVGPKGEKGEVGQKGEKGEKGEKGQKGERTSSAEYFEGNNTTIFTNSDSSTYLITGLKGQKGEQGIKGQKGELISNAAFTDANNTVTFTNSDASTFTITGVKGQKGEVGEIANATYTDANNTITYNNQSGSSFTVTGVKGQKGEKGEGYANVSTVSNTSSANVILTLADTSQTQVVITGSGTSVVSANNTNGITITDSSYAIASAANTTSANVQINATGGTGSNSQIKLIGSGLTSVSSDGSGNITITGATPNTFNTPVVFNDYIDIEGVQEAVNELTAPAGTVALNTQSGSLFYVTSQSANWTANFTNVPTTSGYAVTAVVILVQGATAYGPSVIQVNGASQTIKWLGGSSPPFTANKIDILFLTFYRIGSAWTVTGQLNPYG